MLRRVSGEGSFPTRSPGFLYHPFMRDLGAGRRSYRVPYPRFFHRM